MPLVIGIDPGLKGALAFYDGGAVEVVSMPVIPVRKNGKDRNELDGYELARIINARGHIDLAAVERVGAMPRDGAVSAFAFGRSVGEVVGILRAHFIPLDFPVPRTWRKAMGVMPSVSGDKKPSIARATALMPVASAAWAAVRGNGDADTRSGRAEAALIALYAWQKLNQVAA